MKSRLGMALVLLVGLALWCSSGVASASTAINGGGSGFGGLEFSQWTADVALPSHGGLTVNYQNMNSTTGRTFFANGTYDYGVSDIPYTPEEVPALVDRELVPGRCGGRPAAQCFEYIPTTASGLGFLYNLVDPTTGSQVTSLQLTPGEVCEIFTGQINTWNDPQLVQTNPQLPWLASYNLPIGVVARVDGAGESYALSQYCLAVAPAVWQGFEGFVLLQYNSNNEGGQANLQIAELQDNQPISYWPSFIESGGPTSGGKSVSLVNTEDGVANFVTQTNAIGTITYDPVGFAIVRNNFPVATVGNAAGNFVAPNATTAQTALSDTTQNSDGTVNFDFNAPDPNAYFPDTFSYVLAQTGGFDPGKGATLGQFLCYAVGPGQSEAAALKYAPLSSSLARGDATLIAKIPGAPTAARCLPHHHHSGPPGHGHS
jgi:ABC-type phosphate transport system substrate-binding protein